MTIIEQLRAEIGDRYTIERELGGGGMSVVFVAVERALDRRVVIKVLAPELGQTVNAERFGREIATLATLQHPQIVPIFSAGQAGALLYYVMPFVAGESLGARLAREGALPAHEVVRLLVPLARALAYAHSEGIVHRDIKPDNILLAQGEPVLADFGIAKVVRDGNSHGTLTSTGMSIGTAGYMAPEQVLADPAVDGRADVYSLAAVGYELLAGVPPFTGTQQQVLSAHVVKAPPSLADTAPAVPVALRDAIARGLVKEAEQRPTASEFASLLSGAITQPQRALSDSATAVSAASFRRVYQVSAAALIVALGGLGIWWRSDATEQNEAVSSAAAITEERPGVAVLPFERIGTEEDAYLAAGLTEEVMGQLAEFAALRVASRTTVRAYADSALPPAELGRRLNVRALVEGTVQRSGEQLRVSTRLVDVSDGSTLWSERYDRQASDLFAVQREIGSAVVAALTPRLGLRVDTARAMSGTADAQAYDLFLRARYAFDQRGADSIRSAIALFTKATERDPAFARAFAGIAEAAALLPQYGDGTFASQAGMVRDAAGRALALDSSLAAPYVAMASIDKGLGEWNAAEEAFSKALARQPDLATVHQNLGEMYYTLGRLDEARVSLGRSAALEPTNAAIVGEYAFALLMDGAVDSADAVIGGAIARDSGIAFLHFTRGLVLERRGEYAQALQAHRQAYTRTPLPLFLGAQIRLARLANDVAAEREARAQLSSAATDQGSALARAIADAGVAPIEQSVADLARAVAANDPIVGLLPMRLWWFDALRSSSAFAQALQPMRLPPLALTALDSAQRTR